MECCVRIMTLDTIKHYKLRVSIQNAKTDILMNVMNDIFLYR